MPVHVSTHPLIHHKMTVLRNVKTSASDFRHIMREVTFYLGYEATRHLKSTPECVLTPNGVTFEGSKIAESVAVIPVLRAGLGMTDAMLDLIPKAIVHHIGMYRTNHSELPVQYFNKLPKNDSCDVAYILDPCIATSNTLHAVCSIVKRWGAQRIIVMSVIAARDGLQRLQEMHPDVDIYVASIDEQLSEDNMIIPGLGDAGDRIFGTPNDHVHGVADVEPEHKKFREDTGSASSSSS